MLGRASGSGTGFATVTCGVEACATAAEGGAAVGAAPFTGSLLGSLPLAVSFELGAAEACGGIAPLF